MHGYLVEGCASKSKGYFLLGRCGVYSKVCYSDNQFYSYHRLIAACIMGSL